MHIPGLKPFENLDFPLASSSLSGMLVNLGMTANAAAAHENELSGQTSGKSPSSLPSPFLLPFRLMAAGMREQASPSAPNTDVPSASGLSETTSSPIYSARGSIDGERSQEDLAASADNGGRTVSKQPSRSKTSFRFAHPAPTARPKRLRIRPRLLLQLQQVSQTSRPIPTFDVVPFARFGPLAVGRRRFSNSVRPGATDLVVVPCDSHEPATVVDDDRSISSEEEQSEQRQVATLAHNRKDDTQTKGAVTIHQNKETRWTATCLSQGGYEFVCSDEHGVRQCVRWVLRAKSNRRHSGSGSSTVPGGNDDKRFIFSVIDPRTRRHPVMAWMSKSGIDILKQYPESTPTNSATNETAPSPGTREGQQERDPVQTALKPVDEQLSTLILTTGIWIAFREGWSENPLSAEGQGSPVAIAHSQPEAPAQRASNINATGKNADGKRAGNGPADQGGSSFQRAAPRTRFLGRQSMIQGSASSNNHTSESWKVAEDSGQDPVATGAGVSGSKRLAKPQPLASSRSKRLSLPTKKDQRNANDANGISALDRPPPPASKQGNGHHHHPNQNGNGDGGKQGPTTLKKKRRTICSWFELGRKKKPVA